MRHLLIWENSIINTKAYSLYFTYFGNKDYYFYESIQDFCGWLKLIKKKKPENKNLMSVMRIQLVFYI